MAEETINYRAFSINGIDGDWWSIPNTQLDLAESLEDDDNVLLGQSNDDEPGQRPIGSQIKRRMLK